MADPSTTLPLIPSSIERAYSNIAKHIHKTPLLTSKTLNQIASSPAPSSSSSSNIENVPRFNIYFKCENYQRIGAFKARGAFHAITHLIDELGLEEVRSRGVVTHSSGNHAQALALAASTFDIPAHIVMPKISTPSKIAGTQTYTDHVYFSGSTSQEREAMVQEVIERTGAILVPPYDHPDIILGQGTTALELDRQYHILQKQEKEQGERQGPNSGEKGEQELSKLRIVLTPLGGGGLLSGTCVYFSDQPDTLVVGCEPSYQGGNDGEIGFNSRPPKRVENVRTLTIADGLRTPVGKIPWEVFTSGSSVKSKNLEGIYSVTEDEIKRAMKLVLERMKVFIEPSSAVPLAVVLYNEKFRRWVWEKQQQEGKGEPWDIAIVFSGGNTTIDAILGLFGEEKAQKQDSVGGINNEKERAEGVVGLDGKAVAENVAG